MSVLSLLFHTFIRSLRLLLCPYADIRLTHIHVIITITYLVTPTFIYFRERDSQSKHINAIIKKRLVIYYNMHLIRTWKFKIIIVHLC